MADGEGTAADVAALARVLGLESAVDSADASVKRSAKKAKKSIPESLEPLNLAALAAIDEDDREQLVDRLAALNEQLFNTMAAAINFMGSLKPGADKGKQITALDLAKDLPARATEETYARLYASSALWTHTLHATQQAVRGAERCLSARASAAAEEKRGPQAFTDWFMAKLTETHADDLDQLRQESSFGPAKITQLVDALQSGRDAFSPAEQRLWLAS
eukprot:m.232346 g.232346  ORF g.232346 m.232346 type:complete len:219 (+) comp12342_c0_seq1:997-1653(+)